MSHRLWDTRSRGLTFHREREMEADASVHGGNAPCQEDGSDWVVDNEVRIGVSQGGSEGPIRELIPGPPPTPFSC